MATTKSSKPADLAATCRELLTALDKFYGKSQQDIPPQVLESMLLAVCLEDNNWEDATAACAKLLESYFDLNEIRVSSTAELAHTLRGLSNPDWKGLRIRAILRSVFESSYAFDFEKLRRQTADLTLKALKKITELSPFVREFTLQEILGTHAVALDQSMLKAAHWLGLLPASMSLTDAMEHLKTPIRKSDASNFCRQLRRLATDPNFSTRFTEKLPPDLQLADVPARLEELTTGKARKPAKKPESESASTTPPVPAPPKQSKTAKTNPTAAAAPPKSAQLSHPQPAPAPTAKASGPAKPAAPAANTPAPAKQPPKSAEASKPAAKKSPATTTAAHAAAKKTAPDPKAPAKSAPATKKDRK
jgi:hypothetical protein